MDPLVLLIDFASMLISQLLILIIPSSLKEKLAFPVTLFALAIHSCTFEVPSMVRVDFESTLYSTDLSSLNKVKEARNELSTKIEIK